MPGTVLEHWTAAHSGKSIPSTAPSEGPCLPSPSPAQASAASGGGSRSKARSWLPASFHLALLSCSPPPPVFTPLLFRPETSPSWPPLPLRPSTVNSVNLVFSKSNKTLPLHSQGKERPRQIFPSLTIIKSSYFRSAHQLRRQIRP